MSRRIIAVALFLTTTLVLFALLSSGCEKDPEPKPPLKESEKREPPKGPFSE